MEEIKSKLSPMEEMIACTLTGICKTLSTITDERLLAVLGLNLTSARIAAAALKEYVDSMEG